MRKWDVLYNSIPQSFIRQHKYVSKISAHFRAGDKRLAHLRFDNSLASLRLWSFLLSEEERLERWRRAGRKLFGVMKDLGTIPVLIAATDKAIGFYPDGAWWTPCMMELSDRLFKIADEHGIGDDACPVRATFAAFVNQEHFPIPDLCIAAVGSCCDDFSAIMQRIAGLGHKFLWWELPYRKDLQLWYHNIEGGRLPNQERFPESLLSFTVRQLKLVRKGIEDAVHTKITDKMISRSIKKVNRLRGIIRRLRDLSYGSVPVPAPALELLICEAIAIHFCSDLDESIQVLGSFLKTVEQRVKTGQGILKGNPYRLTIVNPVADLKMLNLIEELGGCAAGTEYLFSHAFEHIPEDIPPMEALAYMVLSDPMIGSAKYRANRVLEQARKYRAEGVLICRIPGASHCASESQIIAQSVQARMDIPVLDITVPSYIDPILPALKTRIRAFFEILESRRQKGIAR
ncbi:MAG: 2-hydroxyacyl-CoA dehydratase [Planctomycetes bacterium]|nr:2-hydroxyacyl-CoA dehydratase [Planctomycetota bacterium]